MGAFFLYETGTLVDETAVVHLFSQKGFKAPTRHDLGDCVLLSFGKMAVGVQNYCAADNGDGLFAFGSSVYRGLPYKEGLKRLLKDFVVSSIAWEDLDGQYALIFKQDRRICMCTDPSDLFHVYANRDGSIFSSSLQAMLVADGCKHELNRDALLEQLLTGSVAAPDTLFTDIVLLSRQQQKSSKSPKIEFVNLDCRKREERLRGGSLSECVDNQIAVLRDYFRRLLPMACECGVSLGLSGGYDSRLLLLLALDAEMPVVAHTFSSAAHEEECAIAEIIARTAGIELTTVPVRPWPLLSHEELAANMSDALYYYDGRTNKTMGTFNDVHTRSSRIKALGTVSFGLNGLGGELYRNREHLRPGKVDFGRWFRHFVLEPECAQAIPSEPERIAFIKHIGEKYAKLLKFDRLETIDRQTARHWYRDVWLPYAAGPRLCAENQASFSLMPFADVKVSSCALKATSHVGVGGRLEAAMLKALNPKIAAIPSTYHHPLDHQPLMVGMRDFVTSIIPLGLRSFRAALLTRNQRPISNVEDLPHANLIGPPLELLKGLNLPLNLSVLLSDPVHIDRVVYIAYFLHSFEHVIDFGTGQDWKA